MSKVQKWVCCICGAKYDVKYRNSRIIYGCRRCHKGHWSSNNKELIKVEK